jgi:RNA polymerase sigma-70 factor, ECF subfamily
MSSLVRILGDFDLAEEAVQDAFAVAVERWPRDGVPGNPGAWVRAIARNKGVDRMRREAKRPGKQHQAQALAAGGAEASGEEGPVPDETIADDQLRLVFTCCHPALAPEARVALTLRMLGGLTTAEVARALLVPEATMAQRLVRAKRKIRLAGIPYRVPADHEMPARLGAVLHVVYLVFNEGYAATSGDRAVRGDLCDDALRLSRALAGFMPDEGEVLGLRALLLLHDSRRDARTDARGDLVPLAEQDRSLWDRTQVAEGLALVERALTRARATGGPGPYALQGVIAALHAQAETSAATDWAQVAALYGLLARVAPSPVVELNRAVAVAESDGPDAGLALVDRLSAGGTLDGSHLLHATRADFLRRLGRSAEAATAYCRALTLAPTGPERRFLDRRLVEVEAAFTPGGP